MYTPATEYEYISIKVMLEHELKGDVLWSLTKTDEATMVKSNAVSTNAILKMHLRRYLSDSESSKKRVARDCLFSIQNYYLITSNTGSRNM